MTTAKTPLLILAALIAGLLAGCAPSPIFQTTTPLNGATPAQVAQTPERFASSEVIWGGRIVQVENFADRSEIEVLAYPLDRSQRPKANDAGNGRFIAVISGYVEPLDYPAGRLMTVQGNLNGSRAGKVGDAAYVFPLVKVLRTHVWTPAELESGRSNVHFGLGLGIGIR